MFPSCSALQRVQMLRDQIISTMLPILPVVGGFNQQTLPKLIDPLISPLSANEVIIDFSKVSFVEPFPIVCLITMLSSEVLSDKEIIFKCPHNPDITSYLAACGFLKEADRWATIEGAGYSIDAEPRFSSSTLLPLTCLDSERDIESIISRVSERLDCVMGFSNKDWQAAKKAIRSTVQELCANIFQHADVGHGWIYAQQYRNSFQQQRYVEIAIGDAGCGIKQSLASRFRDFLQLTDEDVLIQMLSRGLSRHSDSNRGMGYNILQRAAKQHDGRFSLRSGTGLVKQTRSKSSVESAGTLPSWPGTQLLITLTCG